MEAFNKIAALLDTVEEIQDGSATLLVTVSNLKGLLEDFHAHYALILKLVSDPEQELAKLLAQKEYSSIKHLYEKLKATPTLSPIIIEKCLSYIINTLFGQLRVVLEGIIKSKKKNALQNLTLDLEILVKL